MPALDYSDQFNTQLSDELEGEFLEWAEASGRMRDLRDYDLRGAWKAGLVGSAGHLPDTFKKPNHPTFSSESIYSDERHPGGAWVEQGGKWTFEPSRLNVELHGAQGLRDYFREHEPDSSLVLPAFGEVRLQDVVRGAKVRNPEPARPVPAAGGVRG